MEGEKKSTVSDVGAWAMNVISSVGIIMANKQLMSSAGYGFGFGVRANRALLKRNHHLFIGRKERLHWTCKQKKAFTIPTKLENILKSFVSKHELFNV